MEGNEILFYAKEPVYFVEDILLARPDENQKAILRSVAQEPMTSVRSGHGIGKSAVESWAVLWFLLTRPFPKIPCTAPTQHQLFDILWAEVHKWIRNNPALEREVTWTKEKIYMRGYPEEWFAVARTATVPDALQGFHAEHLLYIIDEASGVKDIVFEPVLGALTTPGTKLLMCGNPTRTVGFFYDSHHKNREQFGTVHVDGRDSSRVDASFIRKIEEMYGQESDVFRVRVAGEFPKSMPDCFIWMEWCERAAGREPEAGEAGTVGIGVDVARYGDDSSVLYPVIDGCRSEKFEEYFHNDTMEIAGRCIVMIKRYARKYRSARIEVKIDCDGIGAGVYDRLVESRDRIVAEVMQERAEGQGGEAAEFVLGIMECHFGGAGGKVDGGDPVEMENSTGLMWGALREKLRKGELSICSSDRLISQLSTRRYSVNSDGKIVLERKESMKKRGLKSPDIADALALALYTPRRDSYELEF